MGTVRVILADDSALFRSGLSLLLSALGVQVTAEVGDGPELLRALETTSPDAVVVDIRMPPDYHDEGLVLAEDLSRTRPGLGVLVLSTHVEVARAVRLLASSPRHVGYLLKDRVADAGALHDALVRLVDGQAVIDPEIVDRLLGHHSRRTVLAALGDRERDVLRGMAEGRSNAGIAAFLHLSERTVETYAARIFTKLGLDQAATHNRRVQAVLLWLDEHAGSPRPAAALTSPADWVLARCRPPGP